jgi:hypothetical protein
MDDDILPTWEDEPCVIFFSGVFPDRYDFDRLFTDQLMDSLRESEYGDNVVSDIPESFDKIPEKFVSAETWPRTTNLRCRQCTRLFKTRPLTMITHISNEGSIIMDMRTNKCAYCSGDCVATHINACVLDEKTRWTRHKMFSMFYRKLTGIRIDSFPMTNTPSELEIFGGDISTDEHVKSLKFIVPSTL